MLYKFVNALAIFLYCRRNYQVSLRRVQLSPPCSTMTTM